MKIGMLGLGKLGLPVAEAISSQGHQVRGYDIDESLRQSLPPGIAWQQPAELVAWADIIFASPQTPHQRAYEGITPLPDTRADFDYSYLVNLVEDVARIAQANRKRVNLAVISTCLPGTFDREIKPLLNDYVNYIYQPLFIAMGTVKEDYLNPEFVLIGGEDTKIVEDFNKTLHDKPIVKTDIITAEGIKVAYNTWITAKTVIANLWGEIAYKTGMNFDDLHKSWGLATDRIISPRYMRSGMSDGGACHPRDNIALSWLARQLDLSHDIFNDLMLARQNYEKWHAELAIDTAREADLPLILLGKAFKPETDITTGSPALLMAWWLREMDYPYQHYEDLEELPEAVYFIATNHKKYKDYNFPGNSIVINPESGL